MTRKKKLYELERGGKSTVPIKVYGNSSNGKMIIFKKYFGFNSF